MNQPKMELRKNTVISEVAAEAFKLYIDEMKKPKETKKGLVFRNTRVLLYNYLDLKEQFDETIKDVRRFDGISDDLNFNKMMNGDNELSLKSILKSKFRTIEIISYLDNCIEKVKSSPKHTNDQKFEILRRVYLDELSRELPVDERREELALEMSLSVSTVRRYEADIIDELSTLLFGIGANKQIVIQ